MALVNAYSQDQTALVGGVTLNGLPENPFSAASQCLVDFVYRYFEANDRGLRFFTSNNFGGASAKMRLLGGFDESFPLPAAEDRDLCERWGNLTLAPAAIVIHRHRLSLGSFWRQHFRYGRGAYTLFLRRGDRGSNRRNPRLNFYTGLLEEPFRNRSVELPWIVLALLLLSQLAGFCGFAHEASSGASRGRQNGSSHPNTHA